ncbi:MAG TPA: DUF4124 domain-containing protein [Casimicrobiaceae bacterium]|nr:DUF4124 domain-containing protein [Casimicrobiaceae bacterium]
MCTSKRLLVPAMSLAFAGILGTSSAQADVYTWLDASGRLNVSNLTPPSGAQVTNVTHEDPAASARADAARDAAHQAEVQALSQRVTQLESEVDNSTRLPPPMAYAMPTAPVAVQYSYNIVQPPLQPVDLAPSYTGCYSGWPDCTFGWWPGFYYPSTVIVDRNRGRHVHHRVMPATRPPSHAVIPITHPVIPLPGR